MRGVDVLRVAFLSRVKQSVTRKQGHRAGKGGSLDAEDERVHSLSVEGSS